MADITGRTADQLDVAASIVDTDCVLVGQGDKVKRAAVSVFMALIGAGFVPRGPYSGATTYSVRDAVTDQGRMWIYWNASPGSGNAPPTLPTQTNSYWQVFNAASGDVGGPSSSGNGNVAAFDGTSGKQIKDSGIAVSSILALLAGLPESEVTSIGPDDYFRLITPDGSLRKIKARYVLWPLQPYLGTLELEDGSGNILDDGSGNNLAQF